MMDGQPTTGEAVFKPQRGDDVDVWLKRWRDRHDKSMYFASWSLIDGLLNEYRLHADTGTPLSEDIREWPGDFV